MKTGGFTGPHPAPLKLIEPKATHYKLVTFVPEDALEKVSQALFDAGAGRIDRGRIAGRAGTDDDDLGVNGRGHGQIPFFGDFGQDLCGKRPERHRGGAKSVKSKSRTSG